MKVLYVSAHRSDEGTVSGSGIIDAHYREALLRMLGPDRFLVYEVPDPPSRMRSVQTAARALAGWLYGLGASICRRIASVAGGSGVDTVVIATSCYGRLLPFLRSRLPSLRMITVLHNVEAEFYAAKRRREGPIVLPFQQAAMHNERDAARYSDLLIALNERDREAFARRYGRSPEAILPAASEDRRTGDDSGTHSDTRNDPFDMNPDLHRTATLKTMPGTGLALLFVGSDFFANRQGIFWFVEKVLPFCDARLVVVGKGMERHRQALESLCPRVRVAGTVDSLDPYYRACDAVVIPVFEGSGMKTKTAEALMYSKPLLATGEALEGYDTRWPAVLRCDEAPAFLDGIAKLADSGLRISAGQAARAVWQERHSPEAFRTRLAAILDIPGPIPGYES